jgi:hypothetical protein
MTECAARLVDGILPHVPVRQWVLSLPHRLRYLLAWDHELCRAVLAVYARALLSFHRRRALRRRLFKGADGRHRASLQSAIGPLALLRDRLTGPSSALYVGPTMSPSPARAPWSTDKGRLCRLRS